INDSETDSDDRDAALATLAEALFPISHNGELGIEIGALRAEADKFPSVKAAFDAADAQQATFATRLDAIMKSKEIGQSDLAKMIGVQQPAISMMLSRDCRPQRRTIEKIAGALGVKPEDLWPS